MREIKFKRVYQHSETGYILMILWGNIDYKGNNCNDFSLFASPSSVSSYYPIADLQFTGLKDKNGKEIYEGDILRLLETLPTDDPAYPYYCDTMEVCYCEPHCRFGLTDGGAILDIPPNVEIIGNKFENPDLC